MLNQCNKLHRKEINHEIKEWSESLLHNSEAQCMQQTYRCTHKLMGQSILNTIRLFKQVGFESGFESFLV